MDAIKEFVYARAKEPSTWRGIVLCVTAFKMNIDPEQAYAIASLGMALAGGLGVISREK